MTEHNHYYRDIPKWLKRLDIYRLLDLFGVTCPCAQHVAKKSMVAGQRGHKDTRKDWEDIRDTAIRRLQMMDEERDDKVSQIARGSVSAFYRGDRVRKKSGSAWQGIVVGEYSTDLTPEGYAVESEAHPGSVQIYPASALELVSE